MDVTPSVIRALSEKAGAYSVYDGGEEFTFRCVFPGCSDYKKHLWVNPHKLAKDGSKGVYHCWKCGSKGSLSYLLRFLGLQVEVSIGYNLTEYEQAIAKLRGDIPPPANGERRNYSLEINVDYWPTIPPYTQAWDYLTRQRLMTPDVIHRCQFGLGMGKYKNRIIMPEFEDGEMVFWQARSYTGRKPKYVSPVGERDGHIWNLARVRDMYDEVRIAEGILSGIACGVEGVGMYSYNYLPGQVRLLAEAEFKKYLIVFDGQLQAYSATERLAQDLMAYGIAESSIYLVPLPFGYDPDDLGAAMMQRYIAEAVRWSPGWINNYLVGGKLLCPDVKINVNCQNGQEL